MIRGVFSQIEECVRLSQFKERSGLTDASPRVVGDRVSSHAGVTAAAAAPVKRAGSKRYVEAPCPVACGLEIGLDGEQPRGFRGTYCALDRAG